MCHREGVSLQQGMNFQLGDGYSVILMSVRPNSPYMDEVSEDGTTLIYEGHDVPRRDPKEDPKAIDQSELTSAGNPTQNGKFHRAAKAYREGKRDPEMVRVYEKIRPGIWSFNGMFELVDSWIEYEGKRNVFKFKLLALDEGFEPSAHSVKEPTPRRRIIPTPVKLEVWKRDAGICAICGAEDELHFDHIIPYSKGGTSLRAENIQLLCARHNIAKRDKIE